MRAWLELPVCVSAAPCLAAGEKGVGAERGLFKRFSHCSLTWHKRRRKTFVFNLESENVSCCCWPVPGCTYTSIHMVWNRSLFMLGMLLPPPWQLSPTLSSPARHRKIRFVYIPLEFPMPSANGEIRERNSWHACCCFVLRS